MCIAAAVVGAGVVGAAGSAISASQQKKAAQRAGDAQTQAAYAQMEQQQAQFDKIRELLQPFVNTGTNANNALASLLGMGGGMSQQEAIQSLKNSPLYISQLQAGNNAILQNASATGGLRGGNTQAALAKYEPALLASTIQNQVQNLGALSSQGLQAAGGLGQAGQNFANASSNALGQIGQAQAGSALAAGNANAGFANGLAGAIGTGIGAFGGFGGGASLGSGNVFGGGTTSPVTGLNSGVQYPTGGGLF